MARKKRTGKGSSDETAFLNAIRGAPDDDTPRLVYADWLDEHGRPERAELIRVQCELEPVRGRYEDRRAAALHGREADLLRDVNRVDREWFSELVNEELYDQFVVYRRGFPAALTLPAQWVVRYGERIRGQYPTASRLVLFRLNGWGERVAGCPWLKGVRELDLPCWYSEDDARALAGSPYLADVERLTVWWCDAPQTRAFVAGLPRLRELRVVQESTWVWVEAVNEFAGRPVAVVDNPRTWLFPFAADFDGRFFVGKLPDGTQLFAEDPGEADGMTDGVTTALLFDPAGNPIGERELRFPAELLFRPERPVTDWQEYTRRQQESRAARERYLRETIGFEPAFIRVREVNHQRDNYHWYGASRIRAGVRDNIGAPDDPDQLPEDGEELLGYGRLVYDWVTGGSFVFDYGNDWWCDGSGHVTST